MKNLAFCLLVENDREYIEECINSIRDTACDLFFISSSTDGTDSYLKSVGCKELKKEFSRNSFFDNLDYNFYFFIEPNEKLVNGKEEIKKLIEIQDAYSVLLLDNDVLIKTIRLVGSKLNLKFENPVFESIFFEKSKKTNIVLKKIKNKQIQDEYTKIINWKKNDPLNTIPLYYECCFYLKSNKINDFISCSEKYFFLEKNTDLPSYLMIKYYLSYILFYSKKDIKNSMMNLLFCIEKNPTIAEFWCLLGDINFEIKNYQKSYYFYDNAIMLGKSRSNDDAMPIEFKKYSEYPNKMKKKCIELINNV